jgi:Holliday junction resolvase RusA-like endonuclease
VITVTFPYPDRRLSPNARLHYHALAKVKAMARQEAKILATVAIPLRVKKELAASEDKIPIIVRIYPPDNRHRDADNAFASCKAMLDGVADALGVNDRRFRTTFSFMEPAKGGRVEIEI